MKKNILIGILASIMISSTVFAGEYSANTVINGYMTSSRPNPIYNTNPYNISTYAGVGEGGSLKLFAGGEIINIPLSTPLYKLSDSYKDKIVNKDGVWGVERNIGVYEFTGSENWEVYNKNSYKNDSTTLFICDAPISTTIHNGYSTHFDVLSDSAQKTSIYDGISFSPDSSKIIMRFMNVRGINSVDTIKSFLYNQNINGSPIKLFYFLEEPTFEAFDEDLQIKLNASLTSDNIHNIGFTDKNLQKIDIYTDTYVNDSIFSVNTFGDKNVDMLLAGVTDLNIYNGDDNDYFIEKIISDKYSLKIYIKDNNENTYLGELVYSQCDFIKDKNTEIVFESDNDDSETSIKMQINLSKTKIPFGEFYLLSEDSIPISDNCKTDIKTVLPNKVYYTGKGNSNVYLSNTVVSGKNKANSQFDINTNNKNYIFDKNKIKPLENSENLIVNYSVDNKVNSSFEFEYIPDKDIERDINVMFLGDSIINQDYYSKYLKEMFKEDNVNINLIGTRGSDDNKHEGRGGWSAYNYCHDKSAMGYTNPFLNSENKFDFEYYMKSNNLEKPDYVVLNLGINDLNLVGHNSYEEIFENFNTIIDRIHKYDKNIFIIINTPVLLYETETTNNAKNTRLNFNQVLMEEYKNKENMLVCPAYLVLNPRTDYKLLEQVLNEDNQNTTMIVNDTTHPNIYGYKNMANITYTYIKYIETVLNN